MPSDLEALSLGGLDLNDQTTWHGESITIAPPSKRLQHLAAADAESDVLAEAASYELRQVTLTLRYVASGATVDTALTAITDLSSRLQQAEEIEQGIALTWTPANSTHTGTMWVQSGEITDLPVTWEGDQAGWFFANPILTLRLDCFPLIEGAEYTAATLASTSSRIASMEVASVPGDVPALGRLVITDTGTQDRGHVEIGGDRYGYNSASPSDLDLTASADLTALAGTLSGSYIGLTVGTSAIGVCEAQSMPHTGPHNVRAVVERTDATATIRVRAAVQTVDGQWTYTSWRTLPTSIGTYDLLLGDVTFPVVERGNQLSTLRIEAVASTAAVVRVYRINPIPTEVVYGVARQKAGGVPSSFGGFDTFDQSAGALVGGFTTNGVSAATNASPIVVTSNSHGLSNGDTVYIENVGGNTAANGIQTVAGVTTNTFQLSGTTGNGTYTSGGTIAKQGKAPNIGGRWYGMGAVGSAGAASFQVEATGHTARRSAISDGSNTSGSIALVGSAVATTSVQATVKFSLAPSYPYGTHGVLARYVNSSNWLTLALQPRASAGLSVLTLLKVVSGVPYPIGTISSAYFGATNFAHLIRLEVDADGAFRAYWQSTLIFASVDPDLATGGILASGRRGLYDAYEGSTANTRNYDDFQALAAPSPNMPLFSGRSCEIAHDHAIREAAAGTNWAPMARYRGRRLFIPPAGPAGLKTRLVLKDRRTDVDGGVADSADTARSATLYVTPRYLVVP